MECALENPRRLRDGEGRAVGSGTRRHSTASPPDEAHGSQNRQDILRLFLTLCAIVFAPELVGDKLTEAGGEGQGDPTTGAHKLG